MLQAGSLKHRRHGLGGWVPSAESDAEDPVVGGVNIHKPSGDHLQRGNANEEMQEQQELAVVSSGSAHSTGMQNLHEKEDCQSWSGKEAGIYHTFLAGSHISP